ncbi:MAG: SMP-30/gluconolactonase/LRE family protein [bacterium]
MDFVTILDARLRDLVLPNARLEIISHGHLWAEGPVWSVEGDYLLWSDIPQSRVYQWVPDLGVRVYSHASNNSNGQTRDLAGRRITCEHLTRSVVRFEHDGRRVVLASAFDGKRLNSPNDVVVASDGAVWFTDPTYGILCDYEGARAVPEQDGCHVYRIDPQTGAVEAAIRGMIKPNGLAFSPDERMLYVADSSRSHDEAGFCHVMAYPLLDGGQIGGGRVLLQVSAGVPDGLRLDEFGNLWVTSARGVEIFAPDGTALGIINLPEPAANLCFGGGKNNRIFVTASSSVYALYTAVSGAGRPVTSNPA